MGAWDYSTDFLVVGSGGGGMTAAITANAAGLDSIVIEKSAYYGGTTAISGGVIWVPNNPLMKRGGIDDSEQDALVYLKQVIGDDVSEDRIRAYIEQAPKMLEFMAANSLVQFEPAMEYADYYPELRGGKPGGRSLDPLPYTRRKLGSLLERQMRPPTHGQILDRFTLTAAEAHWFLNFSFKTYLLLIKHLLRFYLDLPFRLAKRPDNRLTLGTALIGRLRKSLELKNIPLWLNCGAKQLLTEGDRVVGLVVEHEGVEKRIEARKGVLIAAGGFAHNAAMRQQYQEAPIGAEWSVACPTNTGDGICMGKAIGAQLGFMECAWWTPTMKMPDGRAEALIIGKSMPGCIMVNKAGKRFTNDAAPYEDVVKGQYAAHRHTPSIPCYLVFDARYRRNYPLGLALGPGKVMPDERIPKELLASGWLKKANTLEDLAKLIEIDADGLKATVERHNEFARTGKDLDFGRGDSATDRYYSDHSVGPNSCMAEINRAPFYAIELYPGDLGTKGGLVCNEYAQVLKENGEVIDGLYATGNSSAAVMGNSYPGAGSTIGPSMTFGYIAANHAARK